MVYFLWDYVSFSWENNFITILLTREDSCHLSPSCFPRRLLMSAIMNWKLRVSAMFCVITTSSNTRDQKQETFTIILWSCALAAQGSWPGRVWLLHALLAAVALYWLGQWQWHGHQDTRPPGFPHVPNCRVPRAAREETSSGVWALCFKTDFIV